MSAARVEEESGAAEAYKPKVFERAISVAARAYNEEHPLGGGGDPAAPPASAPGR